MKYTLYQYLMAVPVHLLSYVGCWRGVKSGGGGAGDGGMYDGCGCVINKGCPYITSY